MAGEIVLGYDGEPGSIAALRTAVAVAAAFKRPLIIAFGYAPAAIGGNVADLSREVQELGAQFTEEAMQRAHEMDASVETKAELVNDRPAEAILARGRSIRRARDRRRHDESRPDRGRPARLRHVPGRAPIDAPRARCAPARLTGRSDRYELASRFSRINRSAVPAPISRKLTPRIMVASTSIWGGTAIFCSVKIWIGNVTVLPALKTVMM